MSKVTSPQQDEYRQAFIRHLPKRIEAVKQRIQRYQRDGWESIAMALLDDDIERLADTSSRYDLIEPSKHLRALAEMLGEHIGLESLPDPQQGERMLALMVVATASLVARSDPDPVPPPTLAPVVVAAAAPSEAVKPAAATTHIESHVYHLSDGNALALEIGQRLEADGYKVEPIETVDELSELLMGLSPQLVLVDPSCMSSVTEVGTARRDAEQRLKIPNLRIRLVAMTALDNLKSRLDARRAGVDDLLFPPFDASVVSRQLQVLLTPVAEEKLRVLIVEDDRAQALFAQGVLNNAGMLAQVEYDPMHVLDALESLHPDLVLMDLHMPDADGMELTALIREHPAFTYIPIVFLSGESDPDARFEAINSGGDDFLSKPIRPKNLIAAVQNRVRRVRALQQRKPALAALDDATGLHRRAFVLDRINDALAASSDQRTTDGGVLFLEIDGTAALRDQFGLAAVEELLVAAARVLAAAIGEHQVAASINDNAFLILATHLDDSALDALAQRLRDQLMRHVFKVGGKAIQLRASVGICLLHFGFGDASALLNTAERTCREARIGDQGIKRYQPPKLAALDKEAALIEKLRAAIGSDSLELLYQPIVAVQGKKEAQFQSLLRMREADGRLIPAAEILPLAERARLMIDVDRWVLTHAMNVLREQLARWRSMRMFIPQAMATFTATDQSAWLKAERAAHNLPGSALVLECRLEEALLNPPALAAFASAVRGSGVRLCIGQYEHSTNASRLIDEIPLGFIKLAPKYVAANAPQTVRDELRLVIDRAHAHGIQVIGHQVEDAQSAATLWTSSIDYIQGNIVQCPTGALDFDFNAAAL